MTMPTGTIVSASSTIAVGACRRRHCDSRDGAAIHEQLRLQNSTRSQNRTVNKRHRINNLRRMHRNGARNESGRRNRVVRRDCRRRQSCRAQGDGGGNRIDIGDQGWQ